MCSTFWSLLRNSDLWVLLLLALLALAVVLFAEGSALIAIPKHPWD